MKPALLLVLLALAACGSGEPESTANKASRLENEIGERAGALKAQVENDLSQVERRFEDEASQQLNALNANTANSAAEAAPAAAAGQNRRR